MKNSTTKCPKCLESVTSTEWRPTDGIDPNLRQFHCGNCNHEFYQVVHGSTRRESTAKQLNLI